MGDKQEARRKVRVAVKGEMGRRGWNIQQLIDHSGLDRSTLGDFLDGRRWPQSRTLGAVEKALGWPVSSIALMLEGGDPPAVGVETPALREMDELLYRRPAGLTDSEWALVREESMEFIDWQVERVMRERPRPEDAEDRATRIRRGLHTGGLSSSEPLNYEKGGSEENAG